MKYTLILGFLLTFTLLNAQTDYRPGSYLNQDGEKKVGFILDHDWLSAPKEIEFKSSMDAVARRLTSSQILSFTIDGKSEYISRNVKVDRRGNDIDQLNESRNPSFVEERLFLKVLVKGKANLYKYKQSSFTTYYFQTGSRGVEPLVYKRYLTANKALKINNQFRQQLTNAMECGDDLKKEVNRLEYKQRSLVPYFIAYNECQGGEVIDMSAKKRKDFVHFRIKPGITLADVNYEVASWEKIGFGRKPTFRIGAEAEFILPFNNDKWAIVVEPTYQYYKSDALDRLSRAVMIDYKGIEVPIGARYYMYLNEDSKLFLNLLYSFNFALGSSSAVNLPLSIGSHRDDASAGVGFQLNRLSAEFRYTRKSDLTGDYLLVRTFYQKFSIVFGYQFK